MLQWGGEHANRGTVPSALKLCLVVMSFVRMSTIAVGKGAFLLFNKWSLVKEIVLGLTGEQMTTDGCKLFYFILFYIYFIQDPLA